jgi:hypothetical protein
MLQNGKNQIFEFHTTLDIRSFIDALYVLIVVKLTKMSHFLPTYYGQRIRSI